MAEKRAEKPWYRLRNVVIAGVVLVAALLGVQIYRALTATPGKAINYGQMAVELSEKYQPTGVKPGDPNAFVILREAADQAATVERDVQANGTRGSGGTVGGGPLDYTALYDPASSMTDRQYPGITERTRYAIEQMNGAGVFAVMDEAARTPRAIRPGPQAGPMIGWQLPELGRFRNLARMNGARMVMATETGDPDEFVRAWEANLALARVCLGQHTLIDALVGVAIHALAVNQLSQSLMKRHWDEQTLQACLEAMDRQQAWTAPLHLAFEGERLGFLDTVQLTHTDDGRGSGRLILTSYRSLTGGVGMGGTGNGSWVNNLLDLRIVNLAGIGFASKKATMRKGDEYYNAAIQALKQPRYLRSIDVQAMDAMQESLSPRYAVLKLMLPALSRSVLSMDIHEMFRTGARLQLLIELHRVRHGQYPQRLEQLVPEFLEQVPLDPFSGKPFGYRLLEDDADGRGYLLYAVGLDGKDNGGFVRPGTDSHHALREGNEGRDFVFNFPPQRPKPPEDADTLLEPSSPQEEDENAQEEPAQTVPPDGGD